MKEEPEMPKCDHNWAEINCYIQDSRDCSYWQYQCKKCNVFKDEYHGDDDDDSYIHYWLNGEIVKTGQPRRDNGDI